MTTSDGRHRADAITRPEKKCKLCWKKFHLVRPGKRMWYKCGPETHKAFGLNPKKYWKELICNHFIDGQSKDRNFFCHYTEIMGVKAIKQALPNEGSKTYHIIGAEEPKI